jgi:hypothetical protein
MLVAFFMTLIGLVWAAPGALPPAADPFVRWGRILAGAGMILQAMGFLLMNELVVELGGLIITIGLGATAWAIYNQPCKKQ